MKADTCEQRTLLPATPSELFSWCKRQGTFERLLPPWERIWWEKPLASPRVGAQLDLNCAWGPFHWQWVGEYCWVEEERGFADLQLKGPFHYWRHEHRFNLYEEGKGEFYEKIEYALPGGIIGSTLSSLIMQSQIKRACLYRSRVAAADWSCWRKYPLKPLKIVIAGSSGLVGSALCDFLRSAGHQVMRLVRKPPQAIDEIYWDPLKEEIEKEKLEGQHVVINVTGASLVAKRWSPRYKELILHSREQSTRFLRAALDGLRSPPQLFLSASATGIYPIHTDLRDPYDEFSAKGDHFLADVCQKWEKAAQGVCKDIRTVIMRFGAVLTPRGGLLAALLPLFRSIGGVSLGNGKHAISWIALDDLLYQIYHLIANTSLEGCFNLVAPEPVPYQLFIKKLAKAIRRPSLLSVPSAVIKLMAGKEMTETFILANNPVLPRRLVATGFNHTYPTLESALGHLLGRVGE